MDEMSSVIHEDPDLDGLNPDQFIGAIQRGYEHIERLKEIDLVGNGIPVDNPRIYILSGRSSPSKAPASKKEESEIQQKKYGSML